MYDSREAFVIGLRGSDLQVEFDVWNCDVANKNRIALAVEENAPYPRPSRACMY